MDTIPGKYNLSLVTASGRKKETILGTKKGHVKTKKIRDTTKVRTNPGDNKCFNLLKNFTNMFKNKKKKSVPSPTTNVTK
jgi:hypothetical protein